jgi:RNA polymerase sigma-70 factor, ECF subfamily
MMFCTFSAVTYFFLMYIDVMMQMQYDRNELEKLSRREPGAVEQWFRRYADAVFTFVYYKVGRDKELAQDVVQDTFLEGLLRMAEYDSNKSSMYFWLVLLSRNHIKLALQAKKRNFANLSIDAPNAKYMDYCKKLSCQLIPAEIIHSQEMAELVHVTLSDIPAGYGEILRQHYYSGDSLKQIAALRHISEGAAKVLLHRARKSFEKAFLKLAGNSELADLKAGD